MYVPVTTNCQKILYIVISSRYSFLVCVIIYLKKERRSINMSLNAYKK